MKAVIGPSLSHIINNTPDDVQIAVHVYPNQQTDYKDIEAYLVTLEGASFESRPEEGYIALMAAGPQIEQLAEQGAVQRLEFDAYATDRSEDDEPPGGRAAERLREFIDQRYPDGIPYSPLPEDDSEEEPDSSASAERR